MIRRLAYKVVRKYVLWRLKVIDYCEADGHVEVHHLEYHAQERMRLAAKLRRWEDRPKASR